MMVQTQQRKLKGTAAVSYIFVLACNALEGLLCTKGGGLGGGGGGLGGGPEQTSGNENHPWLSECMT